MTWRAPRGWRRERLLNGLYKKGKRGATAREIRRALIKQANGDDSQWHHGATSGALSRLHQEGEVRMLAKVRPPGSKYHVYVLPEFVKGRPMIDHREHHCPGCRCFADA